MRLALGASERQVVTLLLRDSLKPVLVGLVCGVPFLFLLDGIIRGLLMGIGPHDPMAMASAVVVLLVAAVTAALVPARHAARIDPAEMLKEA